MSRRFPEITRETNGRPVMRAYCAWLDPDTGDTCDTFGPVVKGLCRRHYDQLRQRALVFRELQSLRSEGLPTTCTCSTPNPVAVRLVGRLLVADCYQCGTCGRAVL